MRIVKYAGGLDDEEHTTELADMPVGPSARLFWIWPEREYPGIRSVGKLSIGLDGQTCAGSPPDIYEVNVEAAELGAMLAAVQRLEDVHQAMSGFVECASPEVMGAVVGSIITHLAQRKTPLPSNE
jgi:hypothetical protein